MPITSGTECPVGCGRKRQRGHLMCRACWSHVPTFLQRDVYRTWRAYRAAALNGADDFGTRHDDYEAAADAAIAAVP